MKKLIFLITIFILSSNFVFSQETENKSNSDISVSLNADIVSRYVWRGLLYSNSTNIQPQIGVSYKNFFIGSWGSYALTDNYAEVDFYMGYLYKNFTITINDYYTENEENLSQFDHFNWGNSSTNHVLEASASYFLGKKLPLTVTAATFFYGNDKDANGDNNYSSYFEAKYSFSSSLYNFSFFVGGTPNKGLYASDAAIVNIGCSASKTISIDNYKIPIEASLISNPEAENIFLVLKTTL
ncbi:MAG: TorF family putative porin [Bacteroidota bacterium]|nr:TorF family putative porin [Bacteroidota bacterium]